MKRKKGKSRQWTRRKKRKTARVEEDDAGEMRKKEMDGTKTTTEAGSSSSVAELPLPLDVWGDIFSRLPFKQVLVCRCICRAWNALLARTHHHHNANPATPATLLYFRQSKPERYDDPFPWIRSERMRQRNYLTLVELRNEASYASRVTRIKDRYTCGGGADGDDNFLCPVASCHGLVCFVRKIDRHHRKNIFVGNPLLKEHLLELRPSKINMKTEGSQWWEVVGFGFSPRADRYKILKFRGFDADQDHDHFLICTVGDGRGWGRGKRKVCSPSWRRLLSFPLHFIKHSCPPGSHLNAGIHWLVSDSHKHNSVFISRLDLDTEQFGRVEAPQAITGIQCCYSFRRPSLGVSDGHLIICAHLRGGHINQPVTFGLFLALKVSLVRAVVYMGAQCLGAIRGVALVKVYQSAYTTTGTAAVPTCSATATAPAPDSPPKSSELSSLSTPSSPPPMPSEKPETSSSP